MYPKKRNKFALVVFSSLFAFLLFIIGCQKEVSGVLPATGTTDTTQAIDTTGISNDIDTSGIHAAFSLVASAGRCSNTTVSGSYQAGAATTGANSVAIEVNVTKPGTWTYATTTVNGYKFASSGVFDTTGQKVMILYASGTPLSAGQDKFPLKIGGVICSFLVTVTP